MTTKEKNNLNNVYFVYVARYTNVNVTFEQQKIEHNKRQKELNKVFAYKEYPCKTGLDFIDYCKKIENEFLPLHENAEKSEKYFIGKNKYELMTEGCKAYVFKFSHKMKTIESQFVYDIFKKGNGYFIESQVYNDFINSVFVHLWDLCFDRPCEKMETLLFEATKKGIKECFSEYSDIVKRATATKANGEKYRYYQHMESLDYLKEYGYENGINDISTTDFYTDTIETKETNKVISIDLFKLLDKKTTMIFKAIANGMKYSDIAKALNTTENAIKQTIKYHRTIVKKALSRMA